MVKLAKKKPQKFRNSSKWDEAVESDDETAEQQARVAPPESDDDNSEPEDDQNSEAEPSEDAEEESGDDEDDDQSEEPATKRSKVRLVTPLKKKKPGVIYISSIPKHMNVTILRELMEPYGDVGRIYLQPERKGRLWSLCFIKIVNLITDPILDGTIKKRTSRGKRAMIRYTEGWVEFKRKRAAKAVVEFLNTKPISAKKKSIFCDILWTMKYLPRFKWIHLSERLSYERAVFKQKLRTEISQARKEAGYFQSHLDQSEAVRKKAKNEKKANKED